MRITVCGRIHLGPVQVSANNRMRATCESCGDELTMDQRAQIYKSMQRVRDMLAKYRENMR